MGLLISIIIAVIFSESVKSKIRNGDKFNGVGWAVLCGIFGAGLIPAGIAYGSVNKELDNSDNSPQYKDHARQELETFWKIYVVFIIGWILINIFLVLPTYMNS